MHSAFLVMTFPSLEGVERFRSAVLVHPLHIIHRVVLPSVNVDYRGAIPQRFR